MIQAVKRCFCPGQDLDNPNSRICLLCIQRYWYATSPNKEHYFPELIFEWVDLVTSVARLIKKPQCSCSSAL